MELGKEECNERSETGAFSKLKTSPAPPRQGMPNVSYVELRWGGMRWQKKEVRNHQPTRRLKREDIAYAVGRLASFLDCFQPEYWTAYYATPRDKDAFIDTWRTHAPSLVGYSDADCRSASGYSLDQLVLSKTTTRRRLNLLRGIHCATRVIPRSHFPSPTTRQRRFPLPW